jgi:hypothetical protein
MRLLAAVVLTLLSLSAPAAARDPVTGLVHSFFGGYRPPPYPAGGDCAAIAAAIGPQATWFGTFSGKRIEREESNAFGAEGCFPSEIECRIWQQRAINYASAAVQFTSCRPGVPARLLD